MLTLYIFENLTDYVANLRNNTFTYILVPLFTGEFIKNFIFNIYYYLKIIKLKAIILNRRYFLGNVITFKVTQYKY